MQEHRQVGGGVLELVDQAVAQAGEQAVGEVGEDGQDQAGGLHSLPVTLPQAGSAGSEHGASLEITIDRGGAISLQGRHLELAELAGVATRSARIILVADAEARHGRVVEVVDALRRAGAREIYFATRPPVQDW